MLDVGTSALEVCTWDTCADTCVDNRMAWACGCLWGGLQISAWGVPAY